LAKLTSRKIPLWKRKKNSDCASGSSEKCAVLMSVFVEYERVIDENINATPVVDGGFDNLVAIGHRIVICDGLTSILTDLLNDEIGSLSGGAL
jgi:hypothetical protein